MTSERIWAEGKSFTNAAGSVCAQHDLVWHSDMSTPWETVYSHVLNTLK
jgi:hypothetical protein